MATLQRENVSDHFVADLTGRNIDVGLIWIVSSYQAT